MTDSTAITPFGGLHGSGNDKTQFERIAELERDLAAAQKELERVRDKCNEHYMALAAAQSENAQLKAENSKLRSALELIHFKQEPWQ